MIQKIINNRMLLITILLSAISFIFIEECTANEFPDHEYSINADAGKRIIANPGVLKKQATQNPGSDESAKDILLTAQSEDVNESMVPEDSSLNDESVVFNFDNADLIEVIRMMADHLKINYMVDVKVDRKVTIYTTGELSKKDIWPVFFQILEANGLTAVKKDKLYHIVNLKDAPRMPISSYVGSSVEKLHPDENMIIQIIPLQYISSQEMIKLLTSFMTESGQIISNEQSNTLVVVDTSSNIPKILKLSRTFDLDVFERVRHRFIPLEYGDVDAIVSIMEI